ncbi:hypothetical protein OQ252_10490 [Acetobacter farinalis]|uniref:Lipoprotein n=1 Tax=Acetobacter farinalis TaxID=1260984 RepID=A0ABT3Q963_9PROT|nr:hypothetical protein [Acetobacter farinalis]MCX2561820.1 hypothetical protein [Acetobacter farinalis]NHO30262.1 hypothetical protein [Acetobacter farinalis]
MSSFFRHTALPLSGLVLLSGCIDVPHPFSNPGKEAQRLAANAPPSRLDIPVPAESQLSADNARLWAKDVAAELLQQTIPAMAQPARPGDWWLKMRADVRGDQIVPVYMVMTPKNEVRATQEGAPLSAQLWAAADPATLSLAAQDAAPKVASVLTGIQAADMEKDPHSLKHRAARVYFKGVKGAPGDGDISLSRAFAASFRDTSDTLQNSKENADYSVATTVKLSPGPAGTTGHPQQHIEIVWRVLDKAGKEAGAATQIHDIEAHSLDKYWGDVAVVAAQEAAGAVRQIIDRYSGRENAPLPPPDESVKGKKKNGKH